MTQPTFDAAGVTVSPGDPVTAQAWNDIVKGVDDVVKYLGTSTQRALLVQVQNNNIPDFRVVRITASAGQVTFEAVRPLNASGPHVFPALDVGQQYQIQADAPGFATANSTLTIKSDASPNQTQVTLSLQNGPMPDLFLVKLSDAIAALSQAKIKQIVDASGQPVDPTNVPQDYAALPVLGQSPMPGAVIPQDGVKLAVAAAMPQIVEVPDLTGMTYQQALAVVNAKGLKLA